MKLIPQLEDGNLRLLSKPNIKHGHLTGIRGVDRIKEVENILIVSHGIVLTLYFAKLMDMMEVAYQRWVQLKFLSYGIVEDGVVKQDIVSI